MRKTASSVFSTVYSRSPQFLADALKGLSTSISGRQPTEQETTELDQLAEHLRVPYSEEKGHLLLLSSVWQSSGHTEQAVEVPSVLWKDLGFQNEDPVSDIRGGGELFLLCLAYFVAKQTEHARIILQNRMHRDEGLNYPFAAAGNQVLMACAELFGLVGTERLKVRSYWHLVHPSVEPLSPPMSENGTETKGEEAQRTWEDIEGLWQAHEWFFRVFALFFRLVDFAFATTTSQQYMEFPYALRQAKAWMDDFLQSIPEDIGHLEELVNQRILESNN
jgi:hypothetical protein